MMFSGMGCYVEPLGVLRIYITCSKSPHAKPTFPGRISKV